MYYTRSHYSRDMQALHFMRRKMVVYAQQHSIKAAARRFEASRNTVRLWLRRKGSFPVSSNAVINRLSLIYSYLFIDEIQDLAGYDLELLKLLFLSNIVTWLVGDPRQVTYLTHTESKYKKYKNGLISDFINNELGNKCVCNIDDFTLRVSHRCNRSICNVASLLYPKLPETTPCTCCANHSIEHQGVFLVKPKQCPKYLCKYKPMQLRWSRNTVASSNAEAMNFGEAKGCTFNRVLIYPTKKMIEWIKNTSTELPDEARAKFYVALTRARYSVAIAMDYDNNLVADGIVKYISKSVT